MANKKTPKKKDKEKTIEIKYRIAEIKRLSYIERDFSEYGLSAEDVINNHQGNIMVKLNINLDDEYIAFTVKSVFTCQTEKESYELTSIEVMHKFEVADLQKIFPGSQDSGLEIPNKFMASMLATSIAGTRGIQAVSNSNPVYKNFFIPLTDINSALKGLQEIQDKQD